MKRLFAPCLYLSAAVVLCACGSVPDSIIYQPATAKPVVPTVSTPVRGGIFQANAYRPLFEDRRPRMVGDILTIAIAEKTSAGKSGENSASRSGSTQFAAPTIFGVPATTTAKAALSATSANSFNEKDAITSSNNFTGTITVTVVDVLPNGNLLVSGEKQVAFDKSVEFVRFSGVVNPDNVVSGNVVSSTQVADARVEYRTNSRVDRAEMMSQLARFFLSIMPL